MNNLIAQAAATPLEDSTVEEWKQIAGFSDYDISTHGRIRRLTPGRGAYPGRIRRTHFTRQYPSIRLRGARGLRTKLIHLLVAETFLGPCPDGKEVNHIDLNPANPRLDNLEYITHAENVLHAWRGGRIRKPPTLKGEDSPTSKITLAAVRQIRSDYIPGRVKQVDLAKKYGLGQSSISRIILGQSWNEK